MANNNSYDIVQVEHVFSSLLDKVTATLDIQYNAGRLKGTDYANVLSSALNTIIQESINTPAKEAALELQNAQRDYQFKQINFLTKQMEEIDHKILNEDANTALLEAETRVNDSNKMLIDAQTATENTLRPLRSSELSSKIENILTSTNLTKEQIITEAKLRPYKIDSTQAQIDLTREQVTTESELRPYKINLTKAQTDGEISRSKLITMQTNVEAEKIKEISTATEVNKENIKVTKAKVSEIYMQIALNQSNIDKLKYELNTILPAQINKLNADTSLVTTQNDFYVAQTSDIQTKTALTQTEIDIKNDASVGDRVIRGIKNDLVMAQQTLYTNQAKAAERQTKGYDDNLKLKLFEAQMQAWSMMFSSDPVQIEKPSFISANGADELYDEIKATSYSIN